MHSHSQVITFILEFFKKSFLETFVLVSHTLQLTDRVFVIFPCLLLFHGYPDKVLCSSHLLEINHLSLIVVFLAKSTSAFKT